MIILDTHVWWWMVMSPEELSDKAKETISESRDIRVSAATLLEIAMLQHKGRIVIHLPLREWFDLALGKSGVGALPLDPRIAAEAYTLPGTFHKDPADRQIVASARLYGAVLVTKDQKIADYPHVRTLW